MMRMIRGGAPFAFGAALILVLSGCGRGDDTSTPDGSAPRPVQIAVTSAAAEHARVELAGELVARDRIEVATKVAGRILEMPVTEGTPVRRGQVLARLDSPELHFSLAQAQAGLEAARMNAETSRHQVERFRRLAASQVVTPRDLEMTEVAAAAAEAAFAQAEAMAEMSRGNLDYAVLRAPRDGVVVRRMADLGDLALPGMPVVVMEDPTDVEIKVTLPAEVDWPVSAGDSAEVTTSLGNPEPLPAKVDRVSPSADGHTLLAYVKAADLAAPTGSFVRVSLFGPRAEEALRLPAGSLVRRGPLSGVFLARDGRAVLRWLRLAPDGRVASGLAPGDSVIVNPPADLRDNDRVEIGR